MIVVSVAGKGGHSATVGVTACLRSATHAPELKSCCGQGVIPLLGIGVALQQPAPKNQIDGYGTILAQMPQMIC